MLHLIVYLRLLLIKKLLDLLNEQIGKKIVNSDKQLQCAEFVYRCYNDAENAKRDKRYIKLNKGDFYYRNIFNSNEEDTIDRTVRISAIDDLNFEDVEASIKNNINSEPFNEDVQEKIKGYLPSLL